MEIIVIALFVLLLTLPERDQEVEQHWDDQWQINRQGYNNVFKKGE